VILRQFESSNDQQEEMSVYAPEEFEALERQRNINSRENLHLMLITDDISLTNF